MFDESRNVQSQKDKIKGHYSPAKRSTFRYDNTEYLNQFEDTNGRATMQRSGQESQENPLSNTHHYYQPLPSAALKTIMNEENFKEETRQVYNQHNIQGEALPETLYDVQGVGGQESYETQKHYYQASPYAQQTAPKSLSLLLERFRIAIRERGGKGILGLLRQFRIFDVNGNGRLDQYEFKKAIVDYEIDMEDIDIDNLFRQFDANHDGDIDFNEFINSAVGPMSKLRFDLTEKAWEKVSPYNEALALPQLFDQYCASRHPDVQNAKLEVQDAESEFNECFKLLHDMNHNYDESAPVTKDDFFQFFTFQSSKYDTDSLFDIMLTNVFNLDNFTDTGAMPFAGVSHKVTNINSHEAWRRDHHRKLFFGQEDQDPITDTSKKVQWETTHRQTLGIASKDADLGQGAAGVQSFPIQGANPVSHVDSQRWETYSQSNQSQSEQGYDQRYEAPASYDGQNDHIQEQRINSYQDPEPQEQGSDPEQTLEKLRAILKQRGARGLIGLRRVFKISDDNNSMSLDFQEFSGALQDYRVNLTGEERQGLFAYFDRNEDFTVNYDEFLRTVVGEMNGFRRGLVEQAYDKLDRDGSGLVDVKDITGVYDASKHPEVIQGKKSEEEILYDFLDTFEMHSNQKMLEGVKGDHRVTIEEFVEYYNNISCSIDDDRYFELMIKSAWKLDEPNRQIKTAWGGAI